MQVETYVKAGSGVIIDGPARRGKIMNKTLVNGNRQQPWRCAMLRPIHLGALVAVVLLILFCRSGGAESCSPTMLNDVGWGQKILDVYPGHDAKTLLLKLHGAMRWNWSVTSVKAVASSVLEQYVHLFVVENNCIVDVLGMPLTEYLAAKAELSKM